jgi:hypothetical protein
LGYPNDRIYSDYKRVGWNDLRLSKSALAPASETPLTDGVRQSFSKSLSDVPRSIFESVYKVVDIDDGKLSIGPLNPVVQSATRELALSALAHDETAAMIAGNTAQLDNSASGAYGGLDTSISNQTYLSNMTAAAGGLIRQQNMKLESEKARTLGTVLSIIDVDARDRVTYSAYMNARRTGGSLPLTKRLVREDSLFNRQSFENR